MKKWMIRILIFVLLVAILPVSLLVTSASMAKVYDESYYAELSDMNKRLKSAEGKRLIIIGNSDVAFGVNGELVETILAEQGYDYTVCPFGLYGAIGTSAMFDLCQAELREGDLVVFVVEPLDSVLTTYFGASAYLKCAESDASLFYPLSNKRKSSFIGNFVPTLQERYSFVSKGEKPLAEGAYAKSSFNDRCDMTFDREGNVMQLGYDTTVPIDLDQVQIEEEFAEQVNRFIKKANRVGARVTISFSPVNELALQDASSACVARYFKKINETFQCQVISNPNDYIMESGWFYDSNLHLNSGGMTVRSTALAQDLLSYMGCSTAKLTELPSMPAPAHVASEIEVEGNTDAFLYSLMENESGYIVVGLTETGIESESLVVPTTYNGKPVVGFSYKAFEKAENLVELTIPENIEGFPDNMFYKLKTLDRLVLLKRSSVPTVSEHTFDGAEFIRVFVPEEDYAMYRDGAGCGVNYWSDYIDQLVTY